MATSKHFLEQVKIGDVAAALQTALENAGSLKIVTHIAGAGSADDLPDSQKILTHIDAVAGTIETSVGEKFVQDESFKTLCEGHMQQVVAGCSSVRDNLDTIQALLDWVSEDPVVIEGSGTNHGNGAATLDSGIAETAVADEELSVEEGLETGGVAVAAGLGAAAMGAAAASSPAKDSLLEDSLLEDSLLDVLETPAEEAFGDAVGSEEPTGLESLEGLDDATTGESDFLDDLSLESASSEGELDLGGGLEFEGDTGFGDDLGLEESLDPGGDSDAAASLGNDDLGFDLGDSATEGEDAGPETEFLMAEADENTQLFGLGDETADVVSPEGSDFGDFGGDLNDTAAALEEVGSDDPLADLELGDDLGGDGSNGGAFSLADDSAAEAPINLEEDTLAGVSWAESGSSDADLDLGALDLGEDTSPDATPDPEVDDLALDAIGDFDSGMWDEASAETVDLQRGESPAKVSRSLESLFSADQGDAASAEGDGNSGDPLSALFSDTSLDDIPSDSSTGSDSQETMAANPFEIDDLENDPFADLMLDD